ncbi:rod shape-determining protein MreC [Nonomuraea lactucae]|uniref:rod shape-determining protein MreC n=1 Tax=Nonomuraea lactucae TaxID=2249762 RepID=UPI000DE2BB74|nr:rod shape-determining protein MreC [Nonomuraea lactucae]
MRESRRARLILGTLLTAALVILTVDHRLGGSSPFGPLRTAGAWLFGAVEQTAGSVTRPIGELLGAYANAPGARDEIQRLEAENARLRTALIAGRIDAARSEELRRMLGLAGRGGYKIVTANVIARRGSPGFEEAVQIDAGTADGIRPEMTVLNGDGLIGRVVSAAAGTATVVLISDRGSATGARLEGGQEIGVVHGVGDNGRLVQFRLLDSTAPLAPGSRIVSFGSQHGTPYVPGVPIGAIERVEATPGELTRVAFARPFARLSALDVVGVVVRAPERDPRDSVLPPRPQPKKEAVRPPRRDTLVRPERDARDAALRGRDATDAVRSPARDSTVDTPEQDLGERYPGEERSPGRDSARAEVDPGGEPEGAEVAPDRGQGETGRESGGAVRPPARDPGDTRSPERDPRSARTPGGESRDSVRSPARDQGDGGRSRGEGGR